MNIVEKILTFDELTNFAKRLGMYICNNKDLNFISLIGDLGTGKTTFVKNFAKELGIEKNIKSPTFNYVLEYENKKNSNLPLFHFDVYRLGESDELYEIGYEDYLNQDGIIVMEWANLVQDELPEDYLEIELGHDTETTRKIKLTVKNSKNILNVQEIIELC